MGDGGLYYGNVGLKLRIRASWGEEKEGGPSNNSQEYPAGARADLHKYSRAKLQVAVDFPSKELFSLCQKFTTPRLCHFGAKCAFFSYQTLKTKVALPGAHFTSKGFFEN